MFLTSDILLEYEEKIADIFDKSVAELIIGALELLSNVHKVQTYYNFEIIRDDPDDNKFVDCAIASNAHYLVSNDKHFRVLKKLEFPRVNLLKIEEFKELLDQENG